jgi:hypothetical protein
MRGDHKDQRLSVRGTDPARPSVAPDPATYKYRALCATAGANSPRPRINPYVQTIDLDNLDTDRFIKNSELSGRHRNLAPSIACPVRVDWQLCLWARSQPAPAGRPLAHRKRSGRDPDIPMRSRPVRPDRRPGGSLAAAGGLAGPAAMRADHHQHRPQPGPHHRRDHLSWHRARPAQRQHLQRHHRAGRQSPIAPARLYGPADLRADADLEPLSRLNVVCAGTGGPPAAS